MGTSWRKDARKFKFQGVRRTGELTIASKFILQHGELLFREVPDLSKPKQAPARQRAKKAHNRTQRPR
jgi:hypothetical protein